MLYEKASMESGRGQVGPARMASSLQIVVAKVHEHLPLTAWEWWMCAADREFHSAPVGHSPRAMPAKPLEHNRQDAHLVAQARHTESLFCWVVSVVAKMWAGCEFFS